MTDKEIRLPEGLDVETATDVLREFAQTDDAQIVGESTLDSLKNEISEAKEAFAAVLAEQSPQSADTLARQDMDALTEPFRDDEGDIDVDTLRQEPETGQPDDGGADPSGDDGVDIDNLSRSEYDDLKLLKKKRARFRNTNMDRRADEIEAEIADTLGADSFADVEHEVEAL